MYVCMYVCMYMYVCLTLVSLTYDGAPFILQISCFLLFFLESSIYFSAVIDQLIDYLPTDVELM